MPLTFCTCYSLSSPSALLPQPERWKTAWVNLSSGNNSKQGNKSFRSFAFSPLPSFFRPTLSLSLSLSRGIILTLCAINDTFPFFCPPFLSGQVFKWNLLKQRRGEKGRARREMFIRAICQNKYFLNTRWISSLSFLILSRARKEKERNTFSKNIHPYIYIFEVNIARNRIYPFLRGLLSSSRPLNSPRLC